MPHQDLFFATNFIDFVVLCDIFQFFVRVFTAHPKRGGELMRTKEHNLLFIELMVSYVQVFHSKNLCNRIKCGRKVIIGFSQRERLVRSLGTTDGRELLQMSSTSSMSLQESWVTALRVRCALHHTTCELVRKSNGKVVSILLCGGDGGRTLAISQTFAEV